VETFLTLSRPGEAETRVKGSRFLALAVPVESEEEARAVLAARAREMFDATHHCSAWRLRGGMARANDAGEPSGSAGAPILAAIEGEGFTGCCVVVTRYYGGTKLGVGGLVRAYGEAAALALRAAPRRKGVPAVRLRVRYPYEHTAAVMRMLERAGAEEVEHGYASGGGEGEVVLTLPATSESLVRELLRDDTSGRVAPERLASAILYRNEIP
jgi:uncharacterized YigZ family protein